MLTWILTLGAALLSSIEEADEADHQVYASILGHLWAVYLMDQYGITDREQAAVLLDTLLQGQMRFPTVRQQQNFDWGSRSFHESASQEERFALVLDGKDFSRIPGAGEAYLAHLRINGVPYRALALQLRGPPDNQDNPYPTVDADPTDDPKDFFTRIFGRLYQEGYFHGQEIPGLPSVGVDQVPVKYALALLPFSQSEASDLDPRQAASWREAWILHLMRRWPSQSFRWNSRRSVDHLQVVPMQRHYGDAPSEVQYVELEGIYHPDASEADRIEDVMAAHQVLREALGLPRPAVPFPQTMPLPTGVELTPRLRSVGGGRAYVIARQLSRDEHPEIGWVVYGFPFSS